MENLYYKQNKPTILIVDDTSTNLMLLSDLLKNDYIVKVAKSAKKGFEILESLEYKIDLILLDVVMPEMDGYTMCKELKNNPRSSNIPVIFVTAKDNEQDEEYGLNLGAIDYITKPFNQTIIKLRVRNQIDLKLKSDMLEELSMYDGLTHIPNRRFFEKHYDIVYKDSKRKHKSLTVMMIDIDFFKPYNDNYGHGKGDETLKKVANTLFDTLKRPNDFVARYGGEEFVVVLDDIDINGCEVIANNLLSNIRDLQIEHKFSQIQHYVTISIGIGFKDKTNETMSHDNLLKIADDALYKAKDNGRNKFEITVL